MSSSREPERESHGAPSFRRRGDASPNWDKRVEIWEELSASPAFLTLRDSVCGYADPQPSDRVLDIGVGTGLLALSLAPKVAMVEGLDSSQAMLERLSINADAAGLRNVLPVLGDLRSLPCEDESFTLVVSNYTFHHVVDAGKEIGLSEVRRVLKPGGRLVVCDMMFSLSLERRDRAIMLSKLWSVGRRGGSGVVRIARNAVRLATGRWEHPASPEAWAQMLHKRHFADISVELLHHEAGIAVARRPLRYTEPTQSTAELPD